MSEYISLNDVVYFTANFYHPASGFSCVADVTPAWLVYESGAALILQGDMTARGEATGSYWGNFVASDGNGFASARYYDVQVSGTVGGITGFAKVKDFVVGDIYDVNVVQVSGGYVHLNDLADHTIQGLTDYGALTVDDLGYLDQDIYFAQIKYISDVTNDADEFAVHWFKNDQPVSSGELTGPCISVYNTATGEAKLEHQSMNYASSVLGVVRHNQSPMVLASGEPYLVEVSGVIDWDVRTWRSIVGIDLL
jgi:hypothetical protein